MNKISLARLTVIAALVLTAQPTQALEPQLWWADCRHGKIGKTFEHTGDTWNDAVAIDDKEDIFTVRITFDEFRKLLKDLPEITRELKACDAYRKCTEDRDAGKVKHCYRNDRRWRKYIDGGW